MDNSVQRPSYQQVKAMIKQFTGQANTLVIPRVFIDLTGDHLAALLLSQILYWSDKTNDPNGWFYKTADEWQTEIGMSGYQVKRAATILAKFGVVTEVHKVKTTPKMHYRIDMQIFTDLILKFLESQEVSKSTNYMLESQETSKSLEVKETSKSYKEHRLHTEITSRESEPKKPKQLDELSRALFSLCLIDPDTASKPELAAMRKTYRGLVDKNVTTEQVSAQFTDYWYSDSNWRTRKAHEGGYTPEPPKPDQVLTEWPKAMAWKPAKKVSNGTHAPADLPLVTANPNRQPTPEERRAIAQRRQAILEETRSAGK